MITAAVLRAGRGKNTEGFAGRAGESVVLAADIEAGRCQPWKVPGPLLDMLALALGPEAGEMFWTACLCDLLLADLLGGDAVAAGIAATAVLGDPAQRGTARALLRWAVQGIAPGVPPLLADAERELLRGMAAELAAADTEDAWAGTDLLSLFPAR